MKSCRLTSQNCNLQLVKLSLRRKLFPVQWLSPAIRCLYLLSSKAVHIFHSQPKVVFPLNFLAEKLQATWMYFEEQVVCVSFFLWEDSSRDSLEEITEQSFVSTVTVSSDYCGEPITLQCAHKTMLPASYVTFAYCVVLTILCSVVFL